MKTTKKEIIIMILLVIEMALTIFSMLILPDILAIHPFLSKDILRYEPKLFFIINLFSCISVEMALLLYSKHLRNTINSATDNKINTKRTKNILDYVNLASLVYFNLYIVNIIYLEFLW